MARRSRIRVKVHRDGIVGAMTSDEALANIAARGEAVADACNTESSWGGYFTAARVDGIRARATVWSADNRNDEARDQRLVRNMDAS